MLKRFMATSTVILVLTLAASVAIAAPFPSQGSLTIILNYDNGSIPVSDVGVNLCFVAGAFEEGGRVVYVPNGDFTGADEAALLSGGVPEDGEENAVLAKILDTYAAAVGVTGETIITDQYGKVVFDRLMAGIYLLTQSKEDGSDYLIGPVLLPIPFQDENGWHATLSASPKVEWIRKNITPQEPEPEPEQESEPVTEPEPEGRPQLPVPSDDTRSLIPNESDSFVEVDENSAPQGEWHTDDDEWFLDGPPPLSDLPQTGSLRWPIPVLSILGILLVAFGVAINKKQNKLIK